MSYWRKLLKVDPIQLLLSSSNETLTYYVRRDLLGIKDKAAKGIFINKEIDQITKRQQPNGSWIFKSSSVKKYPSINHNLIETFKSLRILVGKYEMENSFEVISRCANYIFSCQTEEGDIRGILGNQYMPYYCGMLIEYLLKAGYKDDDRIERALKWLISSRQNDGGWVIPLQTIKIDKNDDKTYSSAPIIADKNLPSSHLSTGMVLRAFTTHPDYCKTEVIKKAGILLKSSFFKADKYNDRKSPKYWTKFQYPYWWTTLVSSLDTLHYLGFSLEDKDIKKGVDWLLSNQNDNGIWDTKYKNGATYKLDSNQLWVCYDICRVLKKYFTDSGLN